MKLAMILKAEIILVPALEDFRLFSVVLIHGRSAIYLLVVLV